MTVLWTAEALAAATGGQIATPFAATGVSIDSRTVAPGELFVALRGDTDGHRHVAAALDRGAAGAMVDTTDGLAAGARLLVVRDTFTGLQALGAAGRARFGGRAAAVTGSVGKTTTKEMLRRVLGASGSTHASASSYNNHWGVPLTLARTPPGAAFLVAEIGMNHAGEIAPLAALARPHAAAVVSVGSAHIGHLGSLEAIADEKAAIASGLLPGGAAILPADHTLSARMLAAIGGARVRTFGTAEDADARLLACEGDADGSTVTARIGDDVFRFRLGAAGSHMAHNALAALLVAAELGADPRRGAEALEAFRPEAGRGGRQPILGGAAVLLDESYNASGDSIRAALDVLRLVPAQRRVAVLGDMRELGAHAEAEHAALAGAVAGCADVLHSCGPLMRHLHEAVPHARRGVHAPDAETLAPEIAALIRPGDAVLVKGSFGSRMRVVVAALAGRAVGEAA